MTKEITYANFDKILFNRIKLQLDKLKTLQSDMNNEWGLEDLVYRFYHQSFKVYRIQEFTKRTIDILEKIAGEEFTLSRFYLAIVQEGTNHEFDLKHNQAWLEKTRPQLEAAFHSKYFVDQLVKYVEEFQDESNCPRIMPSGWAAILSVFELKK